MLSRYLVKEVYSLLIATITVLLLLFICNQFVHYLNSAANGKLTAKAVMQLMALQIPLLLAYLLPLALFLSILLGYGRLYTDNEMTILFACGVSKLQLLTVTAKLALVVATMVMLLMLFLEPKLAWYRDHIFTQSALASPIEKLFPGRFQTFADGKWVFYIEKISRNHEKMHNIFMARVPTKDSVTTSPWIIVAARDAKTMLDKNNDSFLVFNDGHRYQGIPGQQQLNMVKYTNYGLKITGGEPNQHNLVETLATKELWQMRNTNREAAIELQWRLAMPISVWILLIFALPLSQVKPRQGRYWRLLPAILIYITYADLIFIGQSLLQKGTIPISMGLWPVHGFMLVLAIFCWLLLRR